MIQPEYHEQIVVDTDDEGMVVLKCPADPRHVFKGRLDEGRLADAFSRSISPWPLSDRRLWCPYCGHRSTLLQLSPYLSDRAEAAEQRITERVLTDVAKALSASTRRFNRSAGGAILGLRADVSVPRRRTSVYVRPQPLEATRLDLSCSQCTERVAIYGRAAFCWRCGPLLPPQAAREGLRALTGRLLLPRHPDLPESIRDFLTDHGLHESLEWDAYVHGVALVEAYLLNLYEARVEHPADRPGRGLMAKALKLPTGDWPEWAAFEAAAEVRNSIVHRAGRVDKRLHERAGGVSQPVGERVRISGDQAMSLLKALGSLVDRIEAQSGL